MIKVLNLYSGVGGNRKYWLDNNIEVTAVEIDERIAKIYQKYFPNDKVIVTDAHEYLRKHYKEYDIIWSSPPCPTHSRINFYFNMKNNKKEYKYPDMRLYQEILLLQNVFHGLWIVENVIPYYKPLIEPSVILGRHYFWTNFNIDKKHFASKISIINTKLENEFFDISIKGFTFYEKRRIIRNIVNPEIGKYIMEIALKNIKK